MEKLMLPIPIYATQEVGVITGGGGRLFTLFAGISKEHVTQLKEYSLDESDEDVQNHTSDRKRFGEGSYEDWYANNRTPLSLVDTKTNTLAAFIWFGPKPLGVKSMKHLTSAEQTDVLSSDAGNWYTTGYRAYPPYRGVGIMKKFVTKATEVYLEALPEGKLWIIVDQNNPVSIGLAKALGYEELGDAEDGFVVMVRKAL